MTSERESENDRPRQGSPGRRVVDGGTPGSRRSRTVNSVVAGVSVLAVVGVVAAASFLGGGDGPVDDTQAGAVESVVAEPSTPTDAVPPSETAEATAAPTGDAAAPVDDTCPPVPVAVVDPVQFDAAPPPAAGPWTLDLATTCGDITLALDGAAAPQGVGNLVFLAQQGFFDGTPCHRLTTEGIFVLQCGDPTGTGTGGPGYSFGPIENAPADDVYPAGTVAMARVGGDGESMGSQFFLVYEDSTIPSDGAGGYTVLGQVTEGLDIVQLIAEGGLAPDGVAPARNIGIVSATAEESA